MSFADTKWGGFAKIIVDTSTMTVGDTVRVRSMTDSNAVYNKQVVTVGTPIIFETEIYKDYVKICLVQDIGGVATEVGGVYKEVDYGRVLYINVLDKTTLGGIQGILNAHQETTLLNIGDEINITINGESYPSKIGRIDGGSHIIDFVSKYGTSYGLTSNASYPNRANLQSYLTDFYNNMAETDKQYIKDKDCYYQESGLRTITQKVWIPSRNEVFGNLASENNVQLSIFVTQAGRVISTKEGGVCTWQLTSRNTQYNGYTDYVDPYGNLQYTTNDLSALPCFRLTADS